MWSHTSWSCTQAARFSVSAALGMLESQGMANRCPHLPQTTVSPGFVTKPDSADFRRRLATMLVFTSVVPGADGHHGLRLFQHRHHGIRRAVPAVSLR